jgi:hypothetical protein
MATFLIFFLQVFFGLLFFHFFEAHKYLGKSFDWTLWKEENLSTFVWSFGLAAFVCVLMTIDKNSTDFVMKFLGIDMAAEYGEAFTLSGSILGLLIGYATKRIRKPKIER